MKADGTKNVKNQSINEYSSEMGSPLYRSKIPLYPKHMGKSFWFRLREWLTA